ncbi:MULTISPECIES: heme-binding protein [Pseudomonas]|uniref:GlcG/HbpS family heme-binding protein n=1 Tax=Pseudomonas TaxID=286 RepID=UPI001C4901D9|nr:MULTISPECIES: heme-binding protein [Pseudomonas]QXN47686.1 heme-binding protein [Pseudomonas fluorescens]WSO21990.1 heme-binding protein [Pseudomonas fluorescens]
MGTRLPTSWLITLAMTSGFAAAAPDQIAQRKDVSLALANDLLTAALTACHADGRTAVAAVVDRGGNLVAVQRDDDVGPHNTLAAQRKAYTALSTKTSTRLLAERARANPDAENLNTLDELLLLGGGMPLTFEGQVIGAIGVAGAGGAANDEGCAVAAINNVLPSLKH